MQDQSSRPLRVGEQLRRDISNLVRNEVKDPRVSDIIIYDVVVSNDLGTAKVYFSPMDIQQDATEITSGLQSASGFLRTQLSKILHMRKMPELRFILDQTEATSDRIEKLIQQNLNK